MRKATLLVVLLCLTALMGAILVGCGGPPKGGGTPTPTAAVSGAGAESPAAGASGDPAALFPQFRDHLLAGHYEMAWDMLSEKSRKSFNNREEFTQRMIGVAENPQATAELKSYKVTSVNRTDETHATVTSSYLVKGDPAKTATSTTLVVMEEGVWKLELEGNPSQPAGSGEAPKPKQPAGK